MTKYMSTLSKALTCPSHLRSYPLSLPVRHQGLRETCTAFTGASASITEDHYPSDGRLSPEFIYYHGMAGTYSRYKKEE